MHDPHTLSPHTHTCTHTKLNYLCKLACIKTHTATHGHDFKVQSAVKARWEPPRVLCFTWISHERDLWCFTTLAAILTGSCAWREFILREVCQGQLEFRQRANPWLNLHRIQHSIASASSLVGLQIQPSKSVTWNKEQVLKKMFKCFFRKVQNL